MPDRRRGNLLALINQARGSCWPTGCHAGQLGAMLADRVLRGSAEQVLGWPSGFLWPSWPTGCHAGRSGLARISRAGTKMADRVLQGSTKQVLGWPTGSSCGRAGRPGLARTSRAGTRMADRVLHGSTEQVLAGTRMAEWLPVAELADRVRGWPSLLGWPSWLADRVRG
ncbi:hypothetical protein BVRB_010670 [Beta vulgaris subsp. vulgaris]|uniref:Uncharacterized protein n=1 Tax=Beta vulgaris subsp. vulgaris TaxID=3555 RepID=A0A0J8B612_BETVV|nr:hypothetical protein BVRB_010670 [Beta vulgaris subsp. vulgaris]